MSILSALANLGPLTVAASLVALFGIWHLIQYLKDPQGIRANGIPGPLLACFTDAWLGMVALRGHRSETVHALHRKYGKFVRLAPNHVSINDPEALQVVYAHGNGTLKSDFYDAFVSIRRGVFNTRSRAEHSRKRRIITHIFSQKSIQAFEPHVLFHLARFFKQWDKLCEGGLKGLSGPEGEGWHGQDGKVWFDCLPWYNYLAFDIIGDLAFGAPFGMINAARDAAPVAIKHEAAIASYSDSNGKNNGAGEIEIIEVPAVKILNERGEFSATLGVFPTRWRPFLRRFVPWFSKRNESVSNLAGISIAAVAKRLSNPTDRDDLLAKLQAGKDDEGKPMGKEELTAEAQTQLIAGSDTTSNSTCALTYHLARNPHIQAKLQKELDEVFGPLPSSTDISEAQIPTYEQIKSLPYLEAVLHETLRIHSTSGIGLPRVVSEGGLTVLGKKFPEGTILSVPTYSLHRNKQAWGEDVDEFRLERWLDDQKMDHSEMLKSFNPFSFGPRACVGRHFALMELQIFAAAIFRRYEFVLEDPGMVLETHEGFLRKPLNCRVGMKRRFA